MFTVYTHWFRGNNVRVFSVAGDERKRGEQVQDCPTYPGGGGFDDSDDEDSDVDDGDREVVVPPRRDGDDVIVKPAIVVSRDFRGTIHAIDIDATVPIPEDAIVGVVHIAVYDVDERIREQRAELEESGDSDDMELSEREMLDDYGDLRAWVALLVDGHEATPLPPQGDLGAVEVALIEDLNYLLFEESGKDLVWLKYGRRHRLFNLTNIRVRYKDVRVLTYLVSRVPSHQQQGGADGELEFLDLGAVDDGIEQAVFDLGGFVQIKMGEGVSVEDTIRLAGRQLMRLRREKDVVIVVNRGVLMEVFNRRPGDVIVRQLEV